VRGIWNLLETGDDFFVVLFCKWGQMFLEVGEGVKGVKSISQFLEVMTFFWSFSIFHEFSAIFWKRGEGEGDWDLIVTANDLFGDSGVEPTEVGERGSNPTNPPASQTLGWSV
jgi:hypothetical protein